ncbi:hypothetical protein KUTeg_010275 [Tegillarca granosa]|uniref:Uncharacterized protein n=1 Tax=Tegillarca granosa TaxID=220873 RepID=A0ABQ9F977_TEGGR|nr:hypothetical protein KUTeg_010275 [Tegillarca granosa]
MADIFHLDDHKENLKSGIVMDLYFYTLEFAKDNNFSKEKISAFFSIIKKTHEVCIETPFGNVEQTFNYFKELLLCHAVNVRLDLSLSYVGVPVTPPPSEAGEQEEEAKAEGTDGEPVEGDVGVPDGASEHKTPEPDESPARKELRQMIQGYLSEEIKKMKLSVEEQIKSTEETLNKKIDTVEGVAKKGGKGSAKGKKK